MVAGAAMLAGLAPSPATAQEAQSQRARDLFLQTGQGARILAAGPLYRDDLPGCPAAIPACQSDKAIAPGEHVLVDEVKGDLVRALWLDPKGGGEVVEGWVPAAAIRRTPGKYRARDWHGSWHRADSDISIGPGKDGALTVSGEAVWIQRGPNAFDLAAPHVGELEAQARPFGATLRIDPPGSDCAVAMRLAGEYLLVTDNGWCGGMNVTFSGIYRRTPLRD